MKSNLTDEGEDKENVLVSWAREVKLHPNFVAVLPESACVSDATNGS